MLLAVSTVLLVFNVTIGPYHCIAAAPLSWCLMAFLKKRWGYTFFISILGLVIIAACAYAVMHVIDVTWDSNQYHKVDTALLANGWNPFKISFDQFSLTTDVIPEKTDWEIWMDPYPKATYIIGACFYAITGSIEAGKCFNVLGILILLFMGYGVLSRATKLKKWQSFLCALLLAVNPVTVVQALNYYNDGFLGILVGCVALSLIYLDLDEHGTLKRQSWAVALMCTAIGFNTKFSGLIYFVILFAVFYFRWIVRRRKKVGPFKARPYIKKLTLAYIAIIVAAVVFIGATSYLINIIRYGNPLYSVYGSGANTGLISTQVPHSYVNLPLVAQFVCSLFARADTTVTFEGLNLKVPFTVTQYEWQQASMLDLRTSGWGIFFSGVFIISIVIIIIAIKKLRNRRKLRHVYSLTIIMLLVVLVPTLFIPGLWWGRYYLQLFWLPVFALGYMFVTFKDGKKFFKTVFSIAIAGLMIASVVPAGLFCNSEIEQTKRDNQAIARMKRLDKLHSFEVTVALNHFYGMLFNLRDAGITDYTYKYDTQNLNESLLAYMGYRLVPETDYQKYLTALDDPDYCVVVTACGDISELLTNDVIVLMRRLGIEFDMAYKYQKSYIAVIDENEVVSERISNERITYSYETDSLQMDIVSSGTNDMPEAGVLIDGYNFARNIRGINIVVYDKRLDTIVDSVSISTLQNNAMLR